jgi:hypothetical protein
LHTQHTISCHIEQPFQGTAGSCIAAQLTCAAATCTTNEYHHAQQALHA